ncbi:Uncharacterised protein [Mycobacteroides abscessus subsp. abscessus]|nr:Uncharacterised protein [Mycobacteroides abscessus subsp. abscessus]
MDCRYWARPISDPSGQTIELLLMFWALYGTTSIPRRRASRHNPVTTSDLPASELVPATRKPVIVVLLWSAGEQGALLDPAGVDVATAQLNAESTRPRRFAPPTVRGWMTMRVAAHH